MLIMNAVAVHFYARFLKKKQSPLTSKNSEHNFPELMSSQHFVYMSKM